MRNLIGILLIIMMIGVSGCSLIKQCPSEDLIMSGSVYSNDEWRDIYMEIEKGELDNPKNYMTKEQWKKAQEGILFDKECEDCEEELQEETTNKSSLNDLFDSIIELGKEINKK